MFISKCGSSIAAVWVSRLPHVGRNHGERTDKKWKQMPIVRAWRGRENKGQEDITQQELICINLHIVEPIIPRPTNYCSGKHNFDTVGVAKQCSMKIYSQVYLNQGCIVGGSKLLKERGNGSSLRASEKEYCHSSRNSWTASIFRRLRHIPCNLSLT